MRKFMVLIAFAMVALGTKTAKADLQYSGYVCASEFTPPGVTLWVAPGKNRTALSITLYSGPNCTGSYVGWGVFYQGGYWSTVSGATYAPGNYTEGMLMAMLQMAHQAALWGRRCYFETSGATVYGWHLGCQGN